MQTTSNQHTITIAKTRIGNNARVIVMTFNARLVRRSGLTIHQPANHFLYVVTSRIRVTNEPGLELAFSSKDECLWNLLIVGKEEFGQSLIRKSERILNAKFLREGCHLDSVIRAANI
jgi:hypothetical protein